MKGILLRSEDNSWWVRYEFGKGQIKNYPLHPDCVAGADEFGFEGEEIFFELFGTPAPNTLNGFLPSAKIVYSK